MDILFSFFGYIMNFSFAIIGNYGMAIILFTLATKIMLIPVSIWVHKNSIKILKVQPKINYLKAKYFGDAERISEEQALLFKQVKYNPFASIIPLLVQTALLIIVINVIYKPLTYLLNIPSDIIANLGEIITNLTGVESTSSTVEMQIISAIKDPLLYTELTQHADFTKLNTYIDVISDFQTNFISIDLAVVPAIVLGITLLVPFFAAISSLLLCVVQNKANALQMDQTAFIKYFTLIFSVGLSLYLGFFVPVGVALYWIVSNLLSIVQLYILNFAINPSKHVDMEELMRSKEELTTLSNIGSKKKWFAKDENAKREKADYKRFFSIANKKLVFYSESSGFYKYFEGVIEQLFKMSNITIHYITGDPNDKIFEKAKTEPRIKPYYIGERKLITLMMKMDADMVVMTMPDLQNYHIKRSLVRNDVEYVYMFHAPLSFIMTINHGAIDNYDTIFCTGKHQIAEIRESEKLYNLKPKKVVECGYGLIDNMSAHYNQNKQQYQNDVKKILIAPSWQPDNILDSCLDEMLSKLIGCGMLVIVRPHPEYVKRYPSKMNAIVERYKNVSPQDLIIELDFSSNETVYRADILITDWSWIAYEYSLATLKPSLFINTEMKIANPKWEELPLRPLNLTLRNKIGIELEKNEVNQIREKVDYIIGNYSEFENDIKSIRDEYLYNFGDSKKAEATYILDSLKGKK